MSEKRDADAAAPLDGSCPVCRRPSSPVLRPFCSKRCADVDLHRWLAGSYRIPTEDEAEEIEEKPSPSDPRFD